MLGFGILLLAFVGSYFSEDVITLLFGVAYSESGIILSVLIFFLAASFFTIPFTNSLQATHNESKILAIFWIGPCINIGLNYLFFKMYGLIGIAYSTLFVGVFTIFSYSILTWIVLKKQKRIY
jgi:O-antigen/teichoic acid export membrane protein